MELVLNRYVTSVVIIITVPATLFLSCLLLLAPLTASTIISLTVLIPLFRFWKIIIVMFYLCVGEKTFIYYPFRRPSVTLTSPWYDVFGKIKKHPLPKYDMFPEVPFGLGAGQKRLLDYSWFRTVLDSEWRFLILVKQMTSSPLSAQVAILFEYNVLFSARSHTTLTLSFSGQVKSPISVHPRQDTSA